MDEMWVILSIGFSAALLFGVVFGFISFMRYLRYKETIELAKQGLIKPERADQPRMSRSRRTGIMVSAIGLAMTCGMGTIGFNGEMPILGPWLLGGFIPLSIGLAMVYMSNSRDSAETPTREDDDPIPPHKM